MSKITREEAFQLFRYDEESNVLVWREGRQGAASGMAAGTIVRRGKQAFRRVMVRGDSYRVSHIKFLMQVGRWPEKGDVVEETAGDLHPQKMKPRIKPSESAVAFEKRNPGWIVEDSAYGIRLVNREHSVMLYKHQIMHPDLIPSLINDYLWFDLNAFFIPWLDAASRFTKQDTVKISLFDRESLIMQRAINEGMPK